MAKKFCPKCGKEHERLFSQEVLDLREQLDRATDHSEKIHLLMDLADQFSRDLLPNNLKFPEGVHDLVNQYDSARMGYQQAALSLGRFIARSTEGYTDSDEDSDEGSDEGSDEIKDSPTHRKVTVN
jgi:hypothetical protein